MAGLTDDQLKALTDAEMRQSVGYWGGRLAEMRRKAEYYFLGLAKGDLTPPEIEGRSTVVDTTVRNTILWMLPTLIKTFCAGDNVVEFTPTQEQDEDKAKLATDYINYVFYKQNPGFQIVHSWFHDALLQKVGVLKVWWDNRVEESREEYTGQTDEQLAMLLDDPEVEPIEHKAYPDEEAEQQRQQAIQQLQQQLAQAQQAAQQGNAVALQDSIQIQAQIDNISQMRAPMLHDVTLKRTKKSGKVCVENVPPEEFLISRKSKKVSDGFSGHRLLRTISDLKAMGYKNVDNLTSDDSANALNMERIERVGFDDEQPYLTDETTLDPSMRKVWITECYMRADVDGDGIAEWRKVVRAGNEILENVECDGPPFVTICPIPLPHRFFGLSMADLSMEPQRIKTALLRAQLDNLYLQVNGRYFAVENQVNLDDLLTSRPGGVVRIKQPGAVGRLDQAVADTRDAMGMMEWFESFTENSTGWTRYSQGTNGDSLNKTATGVNIITNKADMRLELVARVFAETGFTDLFRLILKLVCQYQDKEAVIRLGDKWVPVDPREWRNQFDLTINVGLGTGNKDQQVQHLLMLQQQQLQGLQIGTATPKNVYNASAKLGELLGFKNAAQQFFTDPTDPNAPKQQQQPNPDVIKAQQADQEHQREMQFKMAQLQFEAQERDKDRMQQAATAERLEQIRGEYALLVAREKNAVDAQKTVTQAHVDLAEVAAEHERTVQQNHMQHIQAMNRPPEQPNGA
jgi:hypothetical protein